jgi:HEPN domain-containing protein
MPQHRPVPGSPEDWLARAIGDLALARVPLPEQGYYEDLCFHAQQAAEKTIKAVYKKHDLTFRYTHDLGELLSDLMDNGIDIPPDVEAAQILTAYAWEARYPGLSEPVTFEEYQEAVQQADDVVGWAESIVKGLSQ